MKKTGDLKKFYYYSFPTQAALVTVKDKEKTNIITVAWHCTISKNPPLYGISIAPQRHSHKLIVENKEFVINFMPYSQVENIQFCGTHSGRNTDKAKETNLNLIDSEKVSTKAIKESFAYFECRFFNKINLGDHTFFVGEVLNAVIEKEKFPKGILDMEKVEPCYYLGDKVYTNFSSEKKKY